MGQSSNLAALCAGDYRLEVEPGRGGSITRFEWRGSPVFRSAVGPAILDAACFPLVPFSNRIAWGKFSFGRRRVSLSPNLPGANHPHALHGFGWLAPWKIAEKSEDLLRIVHTYEEGEWSWPYVAAQQFSLSERGLDLTLSATNLAGEPMPCGMGFHPYFLREGAVYRGLHRSEWETGADGLPVRLRSAGAARDWWEGELVGSRTVDTVYGGRDGPLTIEWPAQQIGVEIMPSSNLPFTTIYVPGGQDFFCVEPVSHATDAANRAPAELAVLAPGESMTVSVQFRAFHLQAREQGFI